MSFASRPLIRALNAPESSDMKASTIRYAERHAAARRRSNYSFKLTGVRMAVIEKLGGFPCCCPAA